MGAVLVRVTAQSSRFRQVMLLGLLLLAPLNLRACCAKNVVAGCRRYLAWCVRACVRVCVRACVCVVATTWQDIQLY